MTCAICCDTFNHSTRAQVICPNAECDLNVCKVCTRTYILSSQLDAHCMGCRIGFDHKFLIANLNNAFVKTDYKAHRRRVLFEEQQARIPSTQTLAQTQIEIDRITKLNNEDTKEIKKLNLLLKALKDTVRARRQHINHIRNGVKEIAAEKREFIMPCPDEECRGYLSSGYKCGLCQKKTCAHCITIIDGEHECDPDMVATAAIIKKDTKPCPTCGERIMKIDGCDQMWCVKCHTTFSWNKGVIEKGNIHNPHYYQWLREQSADGAIPRAPGDFGRDQWVATRALLKRLLSHGKITPPTLKFIERSRIYTRHIGAVNLRDLRPEQPNRNRTIHEMTKNEEELVKFMRNQITEKVFCDGLVIRDTKCKINADFHNIYTMYYAEMDKCFKDIDEFGALSKNVLTIVGTMISVHMKYIEALMKLSIVYKRRTEVIAFGIGRAFTTFQYYQADVHKLGEASIETPEDFCTWMEEGR